MLRIMWLRAWIKYALARDLHSQRPAEKQASQHELPGENDLLKLYVWSLADQAVVRRDSICYDLPEAVPLNLDDCIRAEVRHRIAELNYI